MKHCTLLFLHKDDQILLAMKKRGFGEGRWNGVGGKVDAGETVEQALVRECQEEIGVTPTAFTKVAELDFSNDSTTDPWRQFVHVYACSKWEGEPTESEEMAPKWYNITALPYAEMWQDDQLWLPFVLRSKLVEADFTFGEHDEMLTANLRIVEKLANTQAA